MSRKMSEVIVVGGGAAGMMAAYAAARRGHKVTLLEKNEKLGKKLYITGKGRCNLTNAGDMEDLFSHVMSNPKFLYSALYAFDNGQTVDFFEQEGMRTKVERGSRVFPVSDHASDVTAALSRALKRSGVTVRARTPVRALLTDEEEPDRAGRVRGVLTDSGKLCADAVILATGGLSYPSTGATGDGYRMAEACGHRLVPPSPSLVPLEVREDWVKSLQGLSLKNAGLSVYDGKKRVYEDFGEMLFTHFGVSGPMILSASGALSPAQLARPLTLVVDLKPALDEQQLDRRILRDFEEGRNRQFKNALDRLLPAKLIPVIRNLSKIEPDKPVCEVTRAERSRLAEQIKRLTMTVAGTRGWNEAIITKGGVCVRDINPSTMESRRMKGLYFCGEMIDVDALTGGYNLQIAWSTGHLAGTSVPLADEK